MEGMPLSQAMQQPAQQFIPAPGMQPQAQPMPWQPQYQPGNVPINGQYPQQFQQQQQQQMQQPHPTAPFGQFVGQQQPQQQPFVPQLQMPQIPGPQRLQVQGQEVLDGAGVPMELRGRTVQQVMQIYNALAEKEIARQRQQGGQQPAQQPQQGQPQQPQVGQQAPQHSYWQNPAAATAAQVGQVVQQQIQPLQEYVQRNAIRDAQQQAAQQIPDFVQLQEHIAPIIAGADPRMMADPQFWEGAADLARGRAYRQMQQQRNGQQMQPAAQQRATPAYQLPQPTYSFYTEGPTPPMQQYQNMPGDMSQEQMRAAQGFGMTPDMYRAWQGGVQQQQNGRRF